MDSWNIITKCWWLILHPRAYVHVSSDKHFLYFLKEDLRQRSVLLGTGPHGLLHKHTTLFSGLGETVSCLTEKMFAGFSLSCPRTLRNSRQIAVPVTKTTTGDLWSFLVDRCWWLCCQSKHCTCQGNHPCAVILLFFGLGWTGFSGSCTIGCCLFFTRKLCWRN